MRCLSIRSAACFAAITLSLFHSVQVHAAWKIVGSPDPLVEAMRFDTPEEAHDISVVSLVQENASKGTYLRDWLYPGPSYADGRLDTKVCFRYLNYDPNGTYDTATCTGSINTVYAVFQFIRPVDINDSRFLNLDVGMPEQGVCVGNPINVATGNKFQAEVDYRGVQPEGVQFVRYYNSALYGQSGVNEEFGQWRHTYAYAVEMNFAKYGASQVVLHRPTGEQLLFYRSGENWVAAWETPAKLIEIDGTYEPGSHYEDPNGMPVTEPPVVTNDGWRYEHSGGVIESYDSDGRLMQIWYPSGNRIDLTYDQGLLATVTDSFGRTLTFTNDGTRITQLLDPDGKTYSYQHSSGLLTQVGYPDASSRTYFYDDVDAPGRLSGIEDERGVRIATWDYDASGRAIASEHAMGVERTDLIYNTNNTTTVTNALGHTQTYSFSRRNGQFKIDSVEGVPCTGFAGGTQTYDYSLRGDVTRITNPEGQKRNFVTNTRGLRTQETMPDGTVVNTVWHATYDKPVTITGPTEVQTFTYDTRQRVLTHKREERSGAVKLSRSWTFAYHPDGPPGPNGEPGIPGRLASIDGPRTDVSDVTSFDYDASGNLTTVTNALGHEVHFELYNGNGLPGRIVDANGVVRTLAYDGRGRLLSSIGPDGTTSFEYDEAGLLLRQMLPNGIETEFEYDDAQRLIAVIDGEGNRHELTLDLLGSVTEEVLRDSLGQIQWFEERTFNEIGWLLDVTNALGNTTAYTYNKVADVLTQTDADGDDHTFQYDLFNHPTRVIDPLAGVTNIAWNNGLLYRITDPRSKPTTYTRNGFGEITKTDSRDAGVTNFTYDDAGNLATKTDAKGQVTSYTYDVLNRLTGISTSVSGELPVVLAYDDPSASFAIGRLTSVAQGTNVTQYSYTNQGDVETVTYTLGGQTFSVSYQYDGAGLLTGITYPSGRLVSYERDDTGQIETVETTVSGLQTELATDIERAPFGPITSLTHGNALVETRTLDQAYQTTAITVPGVLARTYTYTDDGNVSAVDGQVFGYDKLNRLISATGLYGTLGFEYDKTSNRTAETRAGVRNAYTLSTSNNWLTKTQPGPVNYTHDANGNITARGSNSYIYDSQNRMVSATVGGVTATYGYNERHQRISKTVGGVTTLYVYGPEGELLAELDGSTGETLREYAWVDGVPLAFFTGGNTYQIHTDHLGTPLVLTDALGAVAWQGSYEPFGAATATGPLTFNLRFPGQYFDAETGLHYNWHRYYDPAIGRYLSYDPIGMEGGINPYLYAGGNPEIFADIYGLRLHGIVVGAFAGGVGGYITGGWDGVLTGTITGAATGAGLYRTPLNNIISAPISNIIGQGAGLYSTGQNITDYRNYDIGSVCGAAFGGVIGNSAGSMVGQVFSPIRTSVIGKELRSQTLNRINQRLVGAPIEGAITGFGELVGSELGEYDVVNNWIYDFKRYLLLSGRKVVGKNNKMDK